MLTFNNDTQLKAGLIKEIIWHREQDMLAKGSYGTQNGSWKGCAVACSLRSFHKLKGDELKEEYSDHSDFEKFGIWPEWLAKLEDTLFENLPEEESQTWPERLAEAVPVGVDITRVKWQFCAFLMRENIDRVLALQIKDNLKEKVVSAIRQVLAVHEKAIETGVQDEAARSAAWSAASAARSEALSEAWSAAESAASAAESAASAARSEALSEAWSAAESAASAASAARSEAESEAWSAAWSAAYVRYSSELIRLLKEAK